MRSWIEISRTRIRENFRAVRALVGDSAEVMPVVKADAYRHGALEVSRALETEGARWLAVSNVEEGIALRKSGIAVRILVMADFLPEERDALQPFNLTPVVHSLDDVAAVRVPYHLKIDSGMSRLGTRAAPEEIVRTVAAAPAQLEGLMTHFASAANYDSRQTEEQIRHFDAVLGAIRAAGFAPRYVHLSSTIPVAYGRTEAWGNLVRPGHAIYGYVSPGRGAAPQPALRVRPALTWKAMVLAVKDIDAGALIGYGGMHRAARPMRIAVLAAGYADGIPHRLSNRGKVIANGKLAPMVGAVSMDLTTIDITACPELRVGDAVTLLGEEGGVSIDAQQIARLAGTISYSVLCGISARVKRVYVD
ncbi:MAG: alanine racemase [Acidobacteria bacterium]|jgi:alanine racemase|nr:MAG: alanine racemase [Acidobacteriota bacterium]